MYRLSTGYVSLLTNMIIHVSMFFVIRMYIVMLLQAPFQMLNHSVPRLFYWQATGALSLIPSLTLSYLYKTPVTVPILFVNWIYHLTRYKLSPIELSNIGNLQKIYVLIYLNARRLQAALSVSLPTPIGGASIEWVNAKIKC